jgi:hypothetical protein
MAGSGLQRTDDAWQAGGRAAARTAAAGPPRARRAPGRRRWLRPGGAVLPDRVALHLAAAGAGALDLAFWDDVQGFCYAPVRPRGRAPLRRPGSGCTCATQVVPVHARGCLPAASAACCLLPAACPHERCCRLARKPRAGRQALRRRGPPLPWTYKAFWKRWFMLTGA